MKILQINSVCGTGSTGKIIVQISDYLDSLNIENYIAYGLGSSSRHNTYKIGNKMDNHLHSFISRKFCLQGYGSIISTLKFIRYIKKLDPTIIHLHNIHGHYLNFPILFRFLKKSKIEVVWTFHDCWPFTGKCAHFTKVKCNKWKTGCSNCQQLHTYPDSEIDRTKRNYIDKKNYFTSLDNLHIVTVSKWLKKIVEESFFKEKDIRCIYNGIDTSIFKPTESVLRKKLKIEDKFIILGVASVWNSGKGLDTFIELAKEIDENCVILLIGVSKEQINSLPSNIIGISRTENVMELVQFYTIADILINCSIEETFGLVVAEAMSCGTPAIVYNSTACPEVINNETGKLIYSNDIVELIEAIESFYNINSKDILKKCRARIIDFYNIDLMLKKYLELYRNIDDK